MRSYMNSDHEILEGVVTRMNQAIYALASEVFEVATDYGDKLCEEEFATLKAAVDALEQLARSIPQQNDGA